LHQLCPVLENERFDPSQIMWTNPFVVAQKYGRIEPKLALSIRCPDVDMRRFMTFIRVKMKSKRTDAQDRRHGGNLLRFWQKAMILPTGRRRAFPCLPSLPEAALIAPLLFRLFLA